MKPLSSMELSILCSNLAKGCEKQYLSTQAEAYRKLAAWYKARADRPAEASFSGLLKKVEENLSADYPAAFDTARGCNDRGAQRALVWSEKVTMILQSLLKRYAAEGEAMLTHTGVWVCTICGFVYAGDTPPEICPVCKVPGKKLEKIGG